MAVSGLKERKHSEVTDLVTALGSEASRLVKPVRLFGTVFLCVGLLSWLLLFASSSFVSFKSFVLSVAFLAFVLTPGAALLWLGSSLRQLALLWGSPRGVKTAAGASEHGEEMTVSIPLSWLRRVRARVDRVLVLWAQLSFSKEKLQQVTGPSRALSFLAHPAAVYLVATAFLIGSFVTLATPIVIIVGLVSRLV